MQEGGMNLTLNEAEIKKRYSIKECKIVLHQVVNSENCAIMWNSEIHNVSESEDTSNDKGMIIRQKRRRMTSRIMRGNRFTRGRVRWGRSRKQRKVSQLIQESANDDNTTNSENSESNTLYNEIDWEENFDCETTLVDEFAPRMPPAQIKKSPSPIDRPLEEVIKKSLPSVQLPDVQVETSSMGHEYTLGLEIYVQIFNTDDWYAATVVEVDWEDDEVLVHYTEGAPPPPDEWVKMNSQRLSRNKPQLNGQTNAPKFQTISQIKKQPLSESEGEEDKFVPEAEDTHSEPDEVQEIIRYHKPAMVRPRKTLKKNKAIMPQGSSSSGNNKFIIGEDVLAKWSDHRMQKFPAKIRTILGDGKYDVLFYDGFEKTITEDQLYKTTPEEVAKYKQANPSEADIFVDMDADSKEARRRRKKKTFDDYVFAKDYKMTKKRVFKSERFGISKKMSYFNKSAEAKETSDSDKPLSRKKMRRRRRALFGPKRDNSKLKLHMLDMARHSENPKSPDELHDNENFYGFDSAGKGEHNNTEILESVESAVEPKLEVKKPRIHHDVRPINITGMDGIVRKSVVVPDSKLPDGWSKHAILKTDNEWEIFLLSPDGYQIANQEELKRYYGTLPLDGEPPSALDFLVDFNILPNLLSQQKEIPVVGIPKVWHRRRAGGRGGRRGGRGHISSGPLKSIGRVRTLLPKYRLDPGNPLPTTPLKPTQLQQPAPLQQSIDPERDIWRCPKEACDKKFRKESLLQMHIKHYHSELSSLVRSVPNMVDLACARSESNNSDWNPTTEVPKVPQTSVKRILPRPFSSSPNNTENIADINASETPIPAIQGPSRNADRIPPESTPLKRLSTGEERRTTIKTMLPIRQPEVSSKTNVDSDDAESDDDYIEQKKNGSRIFKPGRFRRGGKILTGSRADESLGEASMSQMPTFKLTKRRKEKLSLSTSENYESFPEEEKPSPSVDVTEDGVVLERLKSEEVINCICGFREEDGLMIQCDICMCWQHGLCSNIENESDVPDRYVCNICREPFRVRASKKYSYAQHYLAQGKLPTFNFRSRNDDELAHREMILKRCYDLSASLQEIRNVDRSLAAKINIAEKPDHPKLYLWAKSWEEIDTKQGIKNEVNSGEAPPETVKIQSGPEPEAPIDLEECRIRLLDHIEHYYSQLDDRMTSLQTQIAALESLDPDLSSSPSSSEKVTKQTLQMLIRDLNTISKLAAIS